MTSGFRACFRSLVLPVSITVPCLREGLLLVWWLSGAGSPGRAGRGQVIDSRCPGAATPRGTAAEPLRQGGYSCPLNWWSTFPGASACPPGPSLGAPGASVPGASAPGASAAGALAGAVGVAGAAKATVADPMPRPATIAAPATPAATLVFSFTRVVLPSWCRRECRHRRQCTCAT
jgi:hypothetical protein